MTELPLVLEDVSFRYRDRQTLAISGISFAVEPGEILLIAGASGCGKTTLVRAINGLIPRSYKGERTGKIRIFGEETADWKLSQISQKVGTVLQDPERQILGTKVLSEVAFGLENLGLPRSEIIERVDEALTLLKIEHLRERETFLLSGGEKQKVALAGVLAMRPSILLLDEPLASLDPASAQDSLDMVRGLADQGMTVLMVEHRVEDVLRIRPDRVMFLGDGKIRYLGELSGLSKVVDYQEVKLPAEDILERAKADPPPPKLHILPAADSGTNETAHAVLVRFDDVAFGYDADVEVLHGINLEIRRGDVIAVLGP
ncbi:MAG: ATP-binding cassette domain-containing protein, partial [Anaerolineales bacterium]